VLISTLYSEQASIIAAVLCSLIVAGFLKGIIGVGMPVVARRPRTGSTRLGASDWEMCRQKVLCTQSDGLPSFQSQYTR
jgi:hypothetical protein